MTPMRRLLSVLLLLSLALVGCSSSPSATAERPPEIAKPQITFAQRGGEIYFGGGEEASVQFDVEISNRANIPLLVREVEVSSPEMMQYQITRSVRAYNETIPPGETRTLQLTARAVTSSTARRQYDEPLSLRGLVRFEAGGKRFLEIVRQRLVRQTR